MGTTLAEKSFRTKLKALTEPMEFGALAYELSSPDVDDPLTDIKIEYPVYDWSAGRSTEVERVFNQYGAYLELIGGDGPAESPVEFTYIWRSRPRGAIVTDLSRYFEEDRELSMRDEPDSMDYIIDSGMPPVPPEELQ